MWNLSALAAKAQEAAARIEKRLDESVRLNEKATPSTDAAATTTNGDYDDDFFSDDRQEQRDVVEGGDPGDPPTPPHRFAANSESSDLVVEEEVDFGGDIDDDRGAGDGRDDVDEISLDDDEEEGEGCTSKTPMMLYDPPPSPPSYPSEKMTTTTYLKIHSNASPSKLRNIIKNQIFFNDDVQYLKRLVKDVGGMDYAFRFLWYDGPVPVSPNGKKSQSGTAVQYGRTWIQYCCFYNAHQCLRWIFKEITRNHLCKEQQYRKLELDQTSTDISSIADTREDAKDIDEGHRVVLNIIKNLLEFPSISYCGTNYVAVATLRNSYQCLALLIEYGGLDPNMPINSHGSTAAHFAAWKDHVECLQVLQCGTYIDESNEEINLQGTTHGENEDAEKDPDVPHRGAFYALLTASSGKAKWWSAHWNKQNSLGETPMHVAAKEGCKKSMHFFLDLAITAATSSLNEEGNDTEAAIDFSMRDYDGMDCAAVAAKYDQAYIITLFSRSIKRLLDLSVDVHNDLPPPISTQGGLWHGSLALATMASPQRRRTSSEPDNFYSNKEVLIPIRKLPQAPQRSNYHQLCLPHFFPTFNLRNSLEEHNHEMPIHVAARYGNCAAIEALFKSDNCEITSLDSLGQNAVHVAALQGRVDACQLLIHLANDQFKKFDVADNLGRTPLYIACLIGNPSLARILVSSSDWRIICHEQKQPPLFAAVVNDDVNTVGELLEFGVDVNQEDADGRSALSIAAKLGLLHMCQKLLFHGADVNSRSTRGGRTPYQKAKKYKHQEVADLLHLLGGK